MKLFLRDPRKTSGRRKGDIVQPKPWDYFAAGFAAAAGIAVIVGLLFVR